MKKDCVCDTNCNPIFVKYRFIVLNRHIYAIYVYMYVCVRVLFPFLFLKKHLINIKS